MRVTGQVSQIKSRNTNFGEFYDVVVNGKSYGHGKFAPRGIQNGDFVTFECDVVQKGQYTNYNIQKGSLRKDDNPAPAATAPVQDVKADAPAYAGRAAYIPFDERQEIISKQAAMNTALQVCNLAQSAGAVAIPKTAKPADILGLVHQWVLETAQQVYKLTTGRTWEVEAEALTAAPSKPTRAPAKAKSVADEESPLPDTGYDEYNG